MEVLRVTKSREVGSPYAGLAGARRATQIAVLVFFLLLPVVYGAGWLDVHGSLYAMDFWGFLVIDPVIAIQKWILGENSLELILGAAIPVFLALFLGPVFCGWMCPFGLIAELGSRLRFGGAAPAGRVRPPWRGRFAVLVGIFIAATLIHHPLATRFSMPGSLTLAMSAGLASGILLLEVWIVAGVLVLDFLFPRFWCNRVCMQGALLSLLRTPRMLSVHYDEGSCREDQCSKECFSSCPIGIDPRSLSGFAGCTNCGVCLSSCAKAGAGALSFRFRASRIGSLSENST